MLILWLATRRPWPPELVRHSPMTTPSEPPEHHESDPDVTALLLAWRGGDAAATDQLLRVIYDELHRQASRAMRREDSAHTLQATALVNEAYLRLVDQRRVEWRNRAHFFGIAAQLMRRILVDHARARAAAKRGGGERALSLTDADSPVGGATDDGVDVLALHEALEKLAALDPDQARVVELRYFSGLSIDETAEALDVSPATVKREWATARAWLRRELGAA
jgi:RNA polymerase sigma-70 factor (ECF subfamily)